MTDLIAGRTNLILGGLVPLQPFIQAGKLKPIGVTTARRWQGAPDIPAIGESLPGFEVNSWYGLLAPAGTPRDIIQRINAETARGLKEPDARDRFNSFGAEPLANTPEEFGAFIQNEMTKWAKVVKEIGRAHV